MAWGGGGFAEVACFGGVRPSTISESLWTLAMIGLSLLSIVWKKIFIMLENVSSTRWLGVAVGRGEESSTISFPGACMDEPRDRAGTEEIMGGPDSTRGA